MSHLQPKFLADNKRQMHNKPRRKPRKTWAEISAFKCRQEKQLFLAYVKSGKLSQWI